MLRRTLARQICDAGRVTVNEYEARAGRELHVGDLVAIRLHRRFLKFRVVEIPSRAPSKGGSRKMIEVVEDRRTEPDL